MRFNSWIQLVSVKFQHRCHLMSAWFKLITAPNNPLHKTQHKDRVTKSDHWLQHSIWTKTAESRVSPQLSLAAQQNNKNINYKDSTYHTTQNCSATTSNREHKVSAYLACRQTMQPCMKSAPLGLAGGREWSLATEALPVDGDRMTH